MKRATWRGVAIGVGLMVASLVLTPRPVRTQDKQQHLEQFSAFAVNLQGSKPGDRSNGSRSNGTRRWRG